MYYVRTALPVFHIMPETSSTRWRIVIGQNQRIAVPVLNRSSGYVKMRRCVTFRQQTTIRRKNKEIQLALLTFSWTSQAVLQIFINKLDIECYLLLKLKLGSLYLNYNVGNTYSALLQRVNGGQWLCEMFELLRSVRQNILRRSKFSKYASDPQIVNGV